MSVPAMPEFTNAVPEAAEIGPPGNACSIRLDLVEHRVIVRVGVQETQDFVKLPPPRRTVCSVAASRMCSSSSFATAGLART